MTERSSGSFPDGFPENFDVTSFETTAQKKLREGFENLQAVNQATIAEFDPTIPNARASIILRASSEKAEPIIARRMRTNMLHKLNLYPRITPEENNPDPDILFEYHYSGGEVEQIKNISRVDGVKIPVFTVIIRDNNSPNGLESIELLSHDLATQEIKEIQSYIQEYKLNERLSKEFGLDPSFIEKAGLSLQDKQAMIDSYDAITGMPTTEAEKLQKPRERLVKAMLPAIGMLKNRRDRQLPHLRAQYQYEVSQVIEKDKLTGDNLDEFYQRERLLRLSALNQQLRTRKGVVKTSLAAITTGFTAASAGIGAVVGLSESYGLTPVKGAIIGGIGGLAFGVEKIREYRKRSNQIADFSAINPQVNLGEQLQTEKYVANSFFHFIRAHK